MRVRGASFLNISLPDEINYALEKIHQYGFEAFIVGGCVRDALLGRVSNDYDITTNALPEDIILIFKDHRVIVTGLKHGTITIVINHIPIEITTYRVDGKYTDHRHPDEVSFTSDLIEDLKRRDFTINALAYNHQRGIVDYFNGIKDIQKRIIRTVGSPNERFEEDALRIMRALRFSAVLSFTIVEETKISIHANKDKLTLISIERITSELSKMICGRYIEKVIQEFGDIIEVIIPQFSVKGEIKCIGEMETDYNRIAKIVSNTPPMLHLRLAALFYFLHRPRIILYENRVWDKCKYGNEENASFIKEILKIMRFDKETINQVYTLTCYRELNVGNKKNEIKKWLNTLTPKVLTDLLELQRAAALSEFPEQMGKIDQIEKIKGLVDEIISSNSSYSLKDLSVNGRDLIEIGIPQGKIIGEILQQLLDEVIEERLPNEREKLLKRAKSICKNKWSGSQVVRW